MEYKPLLKIREVAQMKGRPLGAIYSMIARGELPSYRVGKTWRVRWSDAEDIPEKQGAVKGPSFLVVDPDPAGQQLLSLMLKEMRFSRTLVGNMEDALSALRKKRFHGIFMNQSSPGALVIIKFARDQDPNYPVFLIRENRGHDVDYFLRYGPVTIISDGR